ncbi:polyprotein [Cucumis melo var. makuwa]|uniref:Polyprotein n=1 Tax=Cucumis melo var. makuwa TaxID=1194695 RepID=A0A5A7SZR3_CUCMM|nr:polyprotein [Cucumis melo var. makuwa]
MKLIKDYGYTIAYHSKKANVVADTSSRKSLNTTNRGSLALLRELRGFKGILNAGKSKNLMARSQVKLTHEEEIVRSQLKDPEFRKMAEEVKCERRSDYAFRDGDALLKHKRLCAPQIKTLRDSILG